MNLQTMLLWQYGPNSGLTNRSFSEARIPPLPTIADACLRLAVTPMAILHVPFCCCQFFRTLASLSLPTYIPYGRGGCYSFSFFCFLSSGSVARDFLLFSLLVPSCGSETLVGNNTIVVVDRRSCDSSSDGPKTNRRAVNVLQIDVRAAW